MLNPQERDAAQALRIAHERRLRAIRQDRTLSVTGRQQAMARAVLGTRGALKQLRADSDARDARRRRQLETSLFGPGKRTASADMISARDAADRAAAVKTPGEAMQLLRRAELAGDAALARAVFSRAWGSYSDAEKGWGDVSRAYLENRPEDNAAAGELAAMLSPGKADRMIDRIHTDLAQPGDLMGSPEAIIARAEPQTAGA